MTRKLPLLFVLAAAACGSDSSESDNPSPYEPGTAFEPNVDPSELSSAVTNPLFVYPVGATWVYEAETEDGLERIEISVDAETKDVWGTTARVVRDTVTIEGELAEDTWDWYAQDQAGHVWYLGEDTAEYEDGEIINHNGAWEAGVDGALPGVVMLADPKVGDTYRQEFLEGEAEDYAIVVSVDESVTVAAGSWSGCLKTQDKSGIDPDLNEYKYYCPGVGNVLVEEGDVRVELIEYDGL